MQQQTVTPFILTFATARDMSISSEMSGYYCEQKNMWIDENKLLPVIDTLKFGCAELLTKTNVNVERDDDSSFSLEMMTKTKVNEESDDTDLKLCIFNELLTKTEVAQEKDDNHMCPDII